jgi:TusA-related sulfurtransferase
MDARPPLPPEAEAGSASDPDEVLGYAIANPQAIVDAGSEHGAMLYARLDRRLSEMAPGQVLQVISVEAAMQSDLADWCQDRGHDIVRTRSCGAETWLWIRRGSET